MKQNIWLWFFNKTFCYFFVSHLQPKQLKIQMSGSLCNPDYLYALIYDPLITVNDPITINMCRGVAAQPVRKYHQFFQNKALYK